MNAKQTTSRKPKTSASTTKRKITPAGAVHKSPTKSRVKAVRAPAVALSVAPATPLRDSKQARLIARLRLQRGATIGQMMTLTGWQAHTVRGAISGVLRKKMGLNVTCTKNGEDGERIYSIVSTGAGK